MDMAFSILIPAEGDSVAMRLKDTFFTDYDTRCVSLLAYHPYLSVDGWQPIYDSFRHLDINASLSRIARDPLRSTQAFRCVSPKGFTDPEAKILNDHGLIQFCLLNTALFDFNDASILSTDKIQDLRDNKLRTCRDRPKLIDALAEGLLHYDRNSAKENIGEPHYRWAQTKKEFQHVQQTLFAYLRLRSKRRFSDHPNLRHVSKSRIMKACESITNVIEALTPDDYRIICEDELRLVQMFGGITTYNPETRNFYAPATLDVDLLLHMNTAFEEYGPKRHYTQDAIFHALAAIYTSFGLEEGDCRTVAQRLLKRFQRRSHSDDTDE
jgi:hypothetical protein